MELGYNANRGRGRVPKRPVSEWRSRLMSDVAPPARPAVAAIVWWDCADLSSSPRQFTQDFEGWLDEPHDDRVTSAELESALVTLGYPAEFAQSRARPRSTISMPRLAERRKAVCAA